MYNRLLEIQVKRTFSSIFQIEKNEVLYYVREIPTQTKYIFKPSKEKILKRIRKMYKVDFLLYSKESLRRISYFVDENADLLMGISFRLSNINSKKIKEQYDLAVDNLVDYIIQTTFKFHGMSRLLTKKKEKVCKCRQACNSSTILASSI